MVLDRFSPHGHSTPTVAESIHRPSTGQLTHLFDCWATHCGIRCFYLTPHSLFTLLPIVRIFFLFPIWALFLGDSTHTHTQILTADARTMRNVSTPLSLWLTFGNSSRWTAVAVASLTGGGFQWWQHGRFCCCPLYTHTALHSVIWCLLSSVQSVLNGPLKSMLALWLSIFCRSGNLPTITYHSAIQHCH